MLIFLDRSVSKWITISFVSSLEGGFAPISVDILYNIESNSSEFILYLINKFISYVINKIKE